MKIIGSFFDQFEGATDLGPYSDNVHLSSAGDWLIVAEGSGVVSAHNVNDPHDMVPMFQAANDPLSGCHHVGLHDAILTVEHDGTRVRRRLPLLLPMARVHCSVDFINQAAATLLVCLFTCPAHAAAPRSSTTHACRILPAVSTAFPPPPSFPPPSLTHVSAERGDAVYRVERRTGA